MSTCVAFVELSLASARLLVTIGSGPCDRVLVRDVGQPYIRVCVQEPRVVNFRVRLGTVGLTDEGLDYKAWDDFQMRGAPLQFFGRAFSVIRFMGENREFVRNLLVPPGNVWLKFLSGQLSRVSESSAHQGLSVINSEDDSRIFIEAQVPSDRIEELLALLNAESKAEPQL